MDIKQGQLIKGTKIRYSIALINEEKLIDVYCHLTGIVMQNQNRDNVESGEVLVRITQEDLDNLTITEYPDDGEVSLSSNLVVEDYISNIGTMILVDYEDIEEIISRGPEQSLSERRAYSLLLNEGMESRWYCSSSPEEKFSLGVYHYMTGKLGLDSEYVSTKKIIKYMSGRTKNNLPLTLNKKVKQYLKQNRNRFYQSKKKAVVVSEYAPPAPDAATIKKVFGEKIEKANPWAGTQVNKWIVPDIK